MSKRITNACAIFSLFAALCFFFASGTALFGAELSMGDIDNYIKLLSQKDNEGRGRVVYEMMLKTRDTPDTIQKKTTIIAMIVTRLSLEETDDFILKGMKSINPQWNVTLSDIELVKSRYEELNAVSQIGKDLPFSGITPVDVDNFLKIFSAPDIAAQQFVMQQLIVNGSYTIEELNQKIEVLGFIAGSMYEGLPDALILEALKEQYPQWDITPNDIDTVMAQREKVMEIAQKLVEQMGYE